MLVAGLSIGARQMVAIFHALATGADLIVMDEPTASLAEDEREIVCATVRKLSRGENNSILFVSHFLYKIIALTDEVPVLRDGAAVFRAETTGLDETKNAEAIVGKEIVALEKATLERSRHRGAGSDTPVLQIKNLQSPGSLRPITLDLRRDKVLGIAGQLGSGRSEQLHAIFCADRYAKGQVLVNDKRLKTSTKASVNAGLALVSEDRFGQGLVPDFEIWRDTGLPALESASQFGFCWARKKKSRVARKQPSGWRSRHPIAGPSSAI